METAVEVGIVDQAFPAHRRTRLLKIDPHDNMQGILQLFPHRRQARAVIERGGHVMDRARPHDDQ